MARTGELRLMTKVARLHHERGLCQPEIAQRLDLSQATISRLLKRAERESIACQVRDVFDAMQAESGVPLTVLLADGGASRNTR